MLDLNGAKVFGNLDLRSGYPKMELHTDSRCITTFSMHLRIYRYKRLNFRKSTASEIFHETIEQVIQTNLELETYMMMLCFFFLEKIGKSSKDFEIVDLLLIVESV